MADSVKPSKKKSVQDIQQELRDLGKAAEERPPVDLKKIFLRAGAVLVAMWIIAFVIRVTWAYAVAGVLTVAGVGLAIWVKRYVEKTQRLGAILRSADTAEGRKDALKQLETDFKKGDVQAVIAKAQLEMQEEPRKALETLEAIPLDKQMAPVAAQVRALRAMLHLNLGEVKEARSLADKLDLGKQQEAKTRVMFAVVASEAWARTGDAKKAIDTLDLFNPEDPEHSDMKTQMYRARAFAYAGASDVKGASRSLKKLAEVHPHLLGMFIGQKRIHPLLEKEAKHLVQTMGVAPRKMVRQRM